MRVAESTNGAPNQMKTMCKPLGYLRPSQRTSRCCLLLLASLASLIILPAPASAAPIATYRFGAGTTTFGLVLPQGGAIDGVQIGTLATQTDVKNRWPDGSIKFAVVSAEIPSAGDYEIAAATSPTGSSFSPTWPAITLDLVINGTTWTASAGSFSTNDLWLDGPVVRERRVKASPMNAGVPHGLLEVIFDVRAYRSGALRIDVAVQNVIDSVNMDKVAVSAVALKANGTALWTHGAVTSYSMTRWRHVEWQSGREAAITPDFEPLYESKAVPRVLSTVINPTYDLNQANYDIMGGPMGYRPDGSLRFAYGEMNPDMGAGGGRREIAPLPWWEAEYLIHKTPNLRQTVIRNGDLSGAWSCHLTKPDGTMIKLGDPGYSASSWWWDARASTGSKPLAPYVFETNFRGARDGVSGLTDTGAAGVDGHYNEEHVPSVWFVPYLITGDRYYVDQAKFWGSCAIGHSAPGWLETDPVNFPGWRNHRDGATGNERILDDSGVTREFAWPLRLVSFVTWMLPDGDTDRAYFAETVQNNLSHIGGYYDYLVAHNYGGALGAMGGIEQQGGWNLSRGGALTGRYSSLWRIAYTAYSVDWCTRQPELWTINSSMNAFVNRAANLFIQFNIQNTELLTGKEGNSWNYYPVFNTMSGGVFNRWFNTWAELKNYNETYAYQDPPAVGNTPGWILSGIGIGLYNTEAHFMYQIGIRRGLADAQNAADRLASVNGHNENLNGRAGYAITFAEPGPDLRPKSPKNVRLVP